MAGLFLLALLIGATAMFFLRPQSGATTLPTFTFLSSRRGAVSNARFLPGEESAIYSASWEGGPLRLYPASVGVRTSDPLNIESADLLSVSSRGELALSLGRRYPLGWEKVGTLAVARPGGAAPRPLLENVSVADWAPDGQTLAVAHEVDGKVFLEYPIGTVLYESPGWISDLRVHPDGDKVLIADNPKRGDNSCVIRIVDRSGQVVTAGIGGSWGVLWAPDGKAVWFSSGGTLASVLPGEAPRVLYQATSGLRLFDIDASGRLLIAAGSMRREMIVRAPNSDEDVNRSWLDWTTPSALSEDGRIALFEEGNNLNDDGYAIYMRDTDGSPPLLLGYGSTLALSPDARQVAVVKRVFGDNPELVLVPAGPGEPRSIGIGNLHSVVTPGVWSPGGSAGDPGSLFFIARDGNGSGRMYQLPLADGGIPLAVTPPEMTLAPRGHVVSVDGRWLVVQPLDAPALRFDLDDDSDGRIGQAVSGMEPADRALRFDRDGEHLYVQASSAVPASIVRINLKTGERVLWRELSPGDTAGVFLVDRVYISTDGAAYVYSIRRVILSMVGVDHLE